MLSPPVVMCRGYPVGGAFDIAVIRLFILTRPIAAPPVSAVLFHFIVKRVIHLGTKASFSIQYAS